MYIIMKKRLKPRTSAFATLSYVGTIERKTDVLGFNLIKHLAIY